MPRELKQDTLADICQKIRDAGIPDLADHIEAAWKRQMSQSWHHREMEELIAKHEKEVAELKKQKTGNAAAMHAALRQIKQMGIELRNIIPHLDKNWEECLKASIRIYQTAEQALLEPPRNCDVGTPKEHERRWRCNCGHGIPRCSKCAVYAEAKKLGLVNNRYLMISDCKFIWAQMPYAEEGGAK